MFAFADSWRQTFRMKLSAAILLTGALLLQGCSAQPYGSGRCPNRLAGWRYPGAVGHQIPAHFVTVGQGGQLSQREWLGYAMTPERTIDRQQLSVLIGRIPDLLPLPMIILQPSATANCDDVAAIRAEIHAKLDCRNGRQCGEGSGWYEMTGMPVIG